MVSIDKTCDYLGCTRYYWFDRERGPGWLLDRGWFFHKDGRALCPTHMGQLRLLQDVSSFATYREDNDE